jgi:hypothetical protein
MCPSIGTRALNGLPSRYEEPSRTKKTKWNENAPYLLVIVRTSQWQFRTANPWWKRVHSRRVRKRVTIKDIIAEEVDWHAGSLEQDILYNFVQIDRGCDV